MVPDLMQDDMVRILAIPMKSNKLVHEGLCSFLKDHIACKVSGSGTLGW